MIRREIDAVNSDMAMVCQLSMICGFMGKFSELVVLMLFVGEL